jgi:colanic acid/amylovoran biosynthesis glycosyltransferase
VALPLAEACGLPIITTFYGHDLSRLPKSEPEWRRRYDELFDRGSHFLVEGSYMKQKLVDLGCPEEKVTVHHLGVKVEDLPYKPRRRDDGAPLRILMAGRFTEKKGFPYAIDAFARFLKNGGNGELTLIGGSRSEQADRDFRTTLAERVAGHGIEDAIHLRGFLPYDDLIQTYLDHHVFLSPSFEAKNGDNEGGAPVTLIEASATGMPVVSTFHCDIPEVVVDGKTGLLAKEKDVSTLAAHLTTLSQNPDRIRELGSAARKRIEEKYNAEVQGRGLDSIYSDIINK